MSKVHSGPADFVFITSDEPWSDIWHTQLHYAFQLSKRFKVIYIDPPDAWRPGNLFNFTLSRKQVNGNLEVIRYKNLVPSFMSRAALKVNDWFNEMLYKRNLKGLNKDSNIIVWRFDPYRSHLIFRGSEHAKHVYHVIDPIAGFHRDEEMARIADIVIVTSPKFISHYQALNKNVVQLGQGVDLGFFEKNYADAELKSLVSYDSILLLGTFSDEIDYRFLKLLAAKYPGKLVLIGPNKTSQAAAAFDELTGMKGVNWLGAMPPSAFHMHLKACRVGIITYTYSNYERNNLRSPLKVISYLASGKCIISNIDCEIPALTNKAIYLVNNDEAYFKLIDESYHGKLQFDEAAVKNFLSAIDYQKLIGTIFEKLKEELPPLK